MREPPKRPRRDPRTERDRRRGRPATQADRPAPEAGPVEGGGRARKDPRAARSAAGAAGRKRIVRGTAAVPVTGEGAVAQASRAADVVRIESPAYLIAVVPDLSAGRLSSHDRDVLGAARALADAGGGAVLAVLFEACRDNLGVAGVDRLVRFRGEAFEGFGPEASLAALERLITDWEPQRILLPDSPHGGADLGRRLAARLGERAATGVWRLDGDDAVRRCDGGRQDERRALSRVVLLAEEAAEPVSGPPREARTLDPSDVLPAARIRDLGLVKADPQQVALDEATFIVAAGNGLANWQDYHELARALGAAEGGSRVVVDKGLLPRARQVGASGTRVTARCYLALGISGATQHLEGISRCDKVISVNRDRACPMVKRADLAVVGDLEDILPALLELARERRRNV